MDYQCHDHQVKWITFLIIIWFMANACHQIIPQSLLPLTKRAIVPSDLIMAVYKVHAENPHWIILWVSFLHACEFPSLTGHDFTSLGIISCPVVALAVYSSPWVPRRYQSRKRNTEMFQKSSARALMSRHSFAKTRQRQLHGTDPLKQYISQP